MGQTYTNLGQGQRAETLYGRAIAFAQESHYLQVEAKAQVGLGELARHRQQGAVALAYFDDEIAAPNQVAKVQTWGVKSPRAVRLIE